MIHYANKTEGCPLISCGIQNTYDLHTVDWSDREQVTCPDCLLMLTRVETFFNEVFLADQQTSA